MSEQGELSDEQVKQMWVDAWLEQGTGVEPDEEEVKALKSFLAKVKQQHKQKRLDRPCPDCKGTGMGQFYFNKNAPCDTCKGTGKVEGLDRPELREKIEENALMCIVDAWLSSHSLSATRGEKLRLVDGIRNQFHSLIPDIEELDKVRDGITKLNKKLDDREEDLIEAKKQERIETANALEEWMDEASPYRKIAQVEHAIAKLKRGEALKEEKEEIHE